MKKKQREAYNAWYLKYIVTPTIQEIMKTTKIQKEIKNKEDFFNLLKEVKLWEQKQENISEETKKQFFLIRNFEGYEEVMSNISM